MGILSQVLVMPVTDFLALNNNRGHRVVYSYSLYTDEWRDH